MKYKALTFALIACFVTMQADTLIVSAALDPIQNKTQIMAGAETTPIIAVEEEEIPVLRDDSEWFTVEGYSYSYLVGIFSIDKYVGTDKVTTVPRTVSHNGYTYDDISIIGYGCFAGNSNLEEVTISGNRLLKGNVFKDCVSLRKLNIDANLSLFYDSSNSEQSGSWQNFYNTGTNAESFTVTFGEKVSQIPAYLFATKAEKESMEYAHVTSLELSSKVKTIGDYAFSNCHDLKDITWGSGVTSIGKGAFNGCSSLENVVLPDKLVSIGDEAFANCTKLTSVTIPETTKEFASNNIFSNPENLTIYGYFGSPAEDYAKEIGATFSGKYIVTQKFTDVKKGAWYVNHVQYVFDQGIMSGKSEDTFDPNGNLTRAEFATVLYSLAGKPDVTYTSQFTDVPDKQWFTKPVMWAYENGIVSGYGNGSFGTNDKITREQLAIMLYKYAQQKSYHLDITDGVLDSFSDKASVSSWATKSVQWAVTQGVISGKGSAGSNYRLDPVGNATRAECAAMIKKLLETN